jgi:hypothetical protein
MYFRTSELVELNIKTDSELLSPWLLRDSRISIRHRLEQDSRADPMLD